MIVEYLRESHSGPVEVDLCIIGAGAAGIAIARSFIGTSLEVCLVEGGGLTGERRNQELYDGVSIGPIPFDPGMSRMRVFGGSCNLWGGGCIPLSEQVLRHRDWVPHSGWPISYSELEPYYMQARSYCGLDEHDFTDGTFRAQPSHKPISFDADKLINQISTLSPVVFGKAYRTALENAPNIRVLLHANLLELKATGDGSSVGEAHIGSLDGHKTIVRARRYVLACGGIENARQLLLSNSVVPEGLDNKHDLVGRFFMDHPCGSLGMLSSDELHRLTRPNTHPSRGKGPVPSSSEISLSEEVQKSHRLLSGRVRPFAVEGPIPEGIRALRDIRTLLRTPAQDEGAPLEEQLCAALRNDPSRGNTTAIPTDGMGTLALRLGLNIGDLARAFVHKLADKPTVKSSHVQLVGFFEQAPNPDSRVMLSNERDALGQRKVCVDWRLTSLDRHTYQTAATLFGQQLAQACGGHFEPDTWIRNGNDNTTPAVHGTAHHMGTTRMSDDARSGVVDRHCKVHGVDNLYVAGSSVFPTGGWAYPTFTIVALSLRLAEHLRATFN